MKKILILIPLLLFAFSIMSAQQSSTLNVTHNSISETHSNDKVVERKQVEWVIEDVIQDSPSKRKLIKRTYQISDNTFDDAVSILKAVDKNQQKTITVNQKSVINVGNSVNVPIDKYKSLDKSNAMQKVTSARKTIKTKSINQKK